MRNDLEIMKNNKKNEDETKNIYLVNVSKRYLSAANQILNNVETETDDSILSVYPFLTSSIEAFSSELRHFDTRLALRRYEHANQTIEDYNDIENFLSITKLLNLGKFHPLESIKAYQNLMKNDYAKYIGEFEKVWSDLRQIRNSIIHPNLVSYKIKVDKSNEAKEKLFNEENVIFLGLFYSDYPGYEKIQPLKNHRLFDKEKLGIDIYTYFSQKKIAEYFYKKTQLFIYNFTDNIKNELFKKRMEDFLKI